MMKLLVFLTRKPGMSEEEFHHYWKDVHGPLVMDIPDLMRHVRKYVQSHASDRTSINFPAEFLRYDGMVELWFNSAEDATKFFNEPRYLKDVRDDEKKFLDLSKCALMVVEEVPKFNAS